MPGITTFKEFLIDMVTSMYATPTIGQTMPVLIKGLYTIPKDLTTLMIEISESFLTIGILITLVYWCFEYLTDVIERKFEVEKFVFKMVRLIVRVMIIANITQLLPYVLTFANELTKELGNLMTFTFTFETLANGFASFAQAVSDNESGSDFVIAVWSGFFKFIELTVQYFMKYFIVFMSIIRNVNACRIMAFAPIGVADMSGGARSSAVRYARNFLAVSMEPVVVLIGMATMSLLLDNTSVMLLIASPIVGYLFPILIFIFSLAFVWRSSQISKEIFC